MGGSKRQRSGASRSSDLFPSLLDTFKHKIVPLNYVPDVKIEDPLKYFRGNFHSICEGNDLKNLTETDHTLHCRFQHHKDPYLQLGPFQLEELHQDPFIVSFKNFLYNNEIEVLKSLASSNLEHSRVAGTAGVKVKGKSDTNLR